MPKVVSVTALRKKNADIFIVTVLVLFIRKIIMSPLFVNTFIG